MGGKAAKADESAALPADEAQGNELSESEAAPALAMQKRRLLLKTRRAALRLLLTGGWLSFQRRGRARKSSRGQARLSSSARTARQASARRMPSTLRLAQASSSSKGRK